MLVTDTLADAALAAVEAEAPGPGDANDVDD
jgi:hypothetical protein